jgi:hypothetical protein
LNETCLLRRTDGLEPEIAAHYFTSIALVRTGVADETSVQNLIQKYLGKDHLEAGDGDGREVVN